MFSNTVSIRYLPAQSTIRYLIFKNWNFYQIVWDSCPRKARKYVARYSYKSVTWVDYEHTELGHVPSPSMGWVRSKTMGHLTQSVSIDDVCKLNISYQCIKK